MSLLPIFLKEFDIGDVTVKIEQEGGIGIGGMVWDASLILARFLYCNKDSIFEGIDNLLEVGSGTGICGLACGLMKPEVSVTLSDLHSHLPLIKTNIDINNTRNVRCEEIDWFRSTDEKKYDMVIGTDCVYDTRLFEPLLDTLDKVTTTKSTVFMCNELRMIRDLGFYKIAQKRGWTLTILPEYMMDKESFTHECPIMRFTKNR